MSRRRSRQSPYRTVLRRSDVDDSRALPRLVIAGGVIGGAFALGLLFGDHTALASDLPLSTRIAQLDDITGEYEQVREQLKLTFHEELTQAEQAVKASRRRREQVAKKLQKTLPVLSASDNPLLDAPEKAEPPKAAAAPHADARAERHAASERAALTASSGAAPGAVVQEEKITAKQAVRGDISSDGSEPDELTSERAKVAVTAPPAAEAPKVKTEGRRRLASALSSLFGEEAPGWAKKVNAASAPVSLKSPARKDENKAKAASTHPTQPFFVQVASTPNADAAKRLQGQLVADGHRAHVIEAQVQGRTVHRLVVQGFQSSEDAQRAKDAIAQSHGLQGFVRVQR